MSDKDVGTATRATAWLWRGWRLKQPADGFNLENSDADFLVAFALSMQPFS